MAILNASKRHQPNAGLKMTDLFAQANQANNISFGMGLPDETVFPSTALQKAFTQAIAQEGADIFQYHSTQGPASLRQKIAAMTKTYFGLTASAEQVILTQGGQQAIDMVGRAFLDKNDHIVVEGPTYMGALEAFDSYEPTYHEVPVNDDGMDIAHLKQILRQFPDIKFVYTVPDFQNPTGVTMSLAKRKALLALAEEYDFYIIEDSPYRYLRYTGDMVPSIASLDTSGKVILISSFSKILSPALRTGWLIANKQLIALFLDIKSALDVQPSQISLLAIDQFLAENNIDEHIRAVNAVYKDKCATMVHYLETYLPAHVQFTKPQGGFFLWLSLPEAQDAGKLLLGPVLQEANVVYVPSEIQYASRQIKNQLRLNFTYPSHDDIKDGIMRLAQVLKSI